jgi:hypothetical protein
MDQKRINQEDLCILHVVNEHMSPDELRYWIFNTVGVEVSDVDLADNVFAPLTDHQMFSLALDVVSS